MSSVEQFNEQYPVGSEFIYIPTKTDEGVSNGLSVKTTSEAWDMCGEACVKVTGQAGGVSISHLVAVEPAPKAPSIDQATHIQVSAQVRYWEGASVNGEDDTDGKLIPCRNNDLWQPLICLEDGQIKDWPEGTVAEVYYKVCDAGEYWLVDKDEKQVAQWSSCYVPDEILCIGEKGYGDYIIFNVDSDGQINDWKPPAINNDEWELTSIEEQN